MSPSDLQACLLPTVVRNINKERSEEVCVGTACFHSTVFPQPPAGRGHRSA